MNCTYDRARRFIYRNARPLDFALWKLHFEGGSADELLHILSVYQNPDGGFGYGLESDAITPHSSPLQTWNATLYLRAAGMFQADHPIVAGVLRYLESGHCFDGHIWDYFAPDVNDYPHSPWWHWNEPCPEKNRDYNPTAALAGYLLRAASPDTSAHALGCRIARECFDFYQNHALSSDMHLLACLRTLCEDVAACEPDLFDHSGMLQRVHSVIAECIRCDADSWGINYGACPSDFISQADEPLLHFIKDIALQEADFLIDSQQEDGAWPVIWRWSDFPDAFAVSANHWQSWFVIHRILMLRSLDRL